MIKDFTLDELGFKEYVMKNVETARIIFFSKTPVIKRDKYYYVKMIKHILNKLNEDNITFQHIKIDWSPELFNFIPLHNHFSDYRNILYYYVFE